MTSTRIHVLCDNRSLRPDFGNEHGLSLCLDLKDGYRLLWDTGQSGLFLDNARKMGIDPASFQGLALSHGHYDHASGLAALLQSGFSGPIHAHPDMAQGRWKEGEDGRPVAIGLNHEGLPEPLPGALTGFVPVSGMAELRPGLTMITDIPRREGRFQSVAGFFLDTELSRPDPTIDDACLVLDTASGPVVVLGCCHSGLANTLGQVRDLLGLEAVHAVLGGFHLHNAPAWAVEETIATLKEFQVRRVLPCHCTGEAATRTMAEALPGRVEPLAAGAVVEF